MNSIEKMIKTIVVIFAAVFLAGLWMYGFQQVRNDSQQRLNISKEGN